MSRHAAALLFCVLSSTGLGQGINFSDFAVLSNLDLNGSAQQVGNELRLTGFTANQTGSFYSTLQQPVLAGFDTTFDFRITPPVVGTIAEGMAFIIHGGPGGSGTLGGSVWGLGYGVGANGSPIPNSIAIEIDTFQDGFLGDTSGNELSIHTNGTAGNSGNENASIGRVTPAVNMSNGQVHTMRVQYVPGTIHVYVDNLTTPVLSANYDLITGGTHVNNTPVSGLNLPNQLAWIGFSASTGAGTLQERVEILNWTFTATPGTDPCYEGNVGGAAGPIDVLTVNSSNGGFDRKVEVFTFDPITIDMAAPPASPAAPYVLFARVGIADGSLVTPTPVGDFCFPVAGGPNQPPGTVIVMESFGVGVAALLPATPAPDSITVPGLPFTAAFTLQGGIVDASSPTGLAVTNAVAIEIVVAPAPTISQVFPLSANPGDIITLMGTGFRDGLTLDVDGTSVMPLVINPTATNFVYPAGVSCDATLTLTNVDGQSTQAGINPTPTFTTSPNSQGPAAGGAPYAIVGSGFSPGSTVTIGGALATINLLSNVVIVVLTPPGTPGPQPVVITTPGGCVLNLTYTYL